MYKYKEFLDQLPFLLRSVSGSSAVSKCVGRSIPVHVALYTFRYKCRNLYEHSIRAPRRLSDKGPDQNLCAYNPIYRLHLSTHLAQLVSLVV